MKSASLNINPAILAVTSLYGEILGERRKRSESIERQKREAFLICIDQPPLSDERIESDLRERLGSETGVTIPPAVERLASNFRSILKNIGCQVYGIDPRIDNSESVGAQPKPLLKVRCRLRNWVFQIRVSRHAGFPEGRFFTGKLYHTERNERIAIGHDWSLVSERRDDRILEFMRNYDSFGAYKSRCYRKYTDLPQTLQRKGYVIKDESYWTWDVLNIHSRHLGVRRGQTDFFVVYVDGGLFVSTDTCPDLIFHFLAEKREWLLEKGYISEDAHYSVKYNACKIDAETADEIEIRVERFVTVLAGEYGERDEDGWLNSGCIETRVKTLHREIAILYPSLPMKAWSHRERSHPIDPLRGLSVNYQCSASFFNLRGTEDGSIIGLGLPHVSVNCYIVSIGGISTLLCLVALHRCIDDPLAGWEDDAERRVKELREIRSEMTDTASLHPIVRRHAEKFLADNPLIGLIDEYRVTGTLKECIEKGLEYYRCVLMSFAQ